MRVTTAVHRASALDIYWVLEQTSSTATLALCKAFFGALERVSLTLGAGAGLRARAARGSRRTAPHCLATVYGVRADLSLASRAHQ